MQVLVKQLSQTHTIEAEFITSNNILISELIDHICDLFEQESFDYELEIADQVYTENEELLHGEASEIDEILNEIPGQFSKKVYLDAKKVKISDLGLSEAEQVDLTIDFEVKNNFIVCFSDLATDSKKVKLKKNPEFIIPDGLGQEYFDYLFSTTELDEYDLETKKEVIKFNARRIKTFK
ncbi:MAG: hypothetical protein ACRCUP_08105 [Mycoplasmatales bacterium]